jgi:hypothetical protein
MRDPAQKVSFIAFDNAAKLDIAEEKQCVEYWRPGYLPFRLTSGSRSGGMPNLFTHPDFLL